MPVIAATDLNTDLGKIMEENGFGLWAESGDIEKMNEKIEQISKDSNLREEMGRKGYNYLLENFSVSHSYKIVMKHFNI